MSSEHDWQIESEDAGERLDRWLARRLDIPRGRAQRWIADGRVHLGGAPVKPSRSLCVGDQVRCAAPSEPPDSGLQPEPGDLLRLHEDDDLIVLDKPAGLAVHPGAGRERDTLANHLLHAYPEIAGIGGPGRPGIVHRLDLDTTGILVVARSERAYRALTRGFAEREVGKTYLAIAYGKPAAEQGEIDRPLGRHPKDRRKMVVRPDGRPARTFYRLRATAEGICLLQLGLETGRTHQIRVHLKSVGHPLVGDPTYGEARWRGLIPKVRRPLKRFPRPALHAWKLAFAHPADGRQVAFEAPIPKDLRRLWRVVVGSEMELD